MMTFDTVSKDIEGLSGMRLRSIGGRADFVLDKFDPLRSSWALTDSKGRERSRPVAEVSTIWDALRGGASVHVETVLKGSGSSRNQPETLLANLPYIEWARLGGKKHLIYVRRCSHEPGTIRRMDPIAESQLDSARTPGHLTAVVLADRLSEAHVALQLQGYSSVDAIVPGAHRLELGDAQLLLVDTALMPELRSGVYPVMNLESAPVVARLSLAPLTLSAVRYLGSVVITIHGDD